MGVAELLVSGRVPCKGTVIDSVDPVVSTQTGGNVESIGPAVIKRTGSIGAHQAQAIEGAVGQYAPAPSLTDIGSVGEDVGQAVVATESEVGHLGAVDRFLRAHGLVEAAPQREGRIAGDGIIHLHAGKIYILRFGGIATRLETDRAEVVAGDLVEDIVGVEQDRRVVVVPRVIHIESGEGIVIDLNRPLDRSQREVEHVLDITVVDRHLDVRLKIVGTCYHQGVHAVLQVRDHERTVCFGHRAGQLGRTLEQDEPGILYRLAVTAAHHDALDAAGRFLSKEHGSAQEGGEDRKQSFHITS